MQWFGVIARLVLGGVWIVAGALKLPDPTESVRAVRNYRLLPEAVVPLTGHLLPLVEIVVGLCLVIGLLVRANAAVSGVLLAAFVVGIASAWARGLSIECGCFGGGGGGTIQDPTAAYAWEIVRDVGLMLAAGWLVWRPRTPWALDNKLFGPLPDLEEVS
ncbi:MAG: MauE/DoxX family redox-associated membrane protein [Nocardioides sp.]